MFCCGFVYGEIRYGRPLLHPCSGNCGEGVLSQRTMALFTKHLFFFPLLGFSLQMYLLMFALYFTNIASHRWLPRVTLRIPPNCFEEQGAKLRRVRQAFASTNTDTYCIRVF